MPHMSMATNVLQRPVQVIARGRSGAMPRKSGPRSDCRLKPACMKAELLVPAGQHTAVNTFPGLRHTAHHVMKAGNT